MVQINFAKREVQCKLVYYGPGMSGKTTNLEQIHLLAPEKMRAIPAVTSAMLNEPSLLKSASS